ncbi:MAG TPA: helix-turn-helix domain-containing protein [Thermoplasmata archaeon]|nr:helix-turn-helix domain-containing protein [Thermoplasmata archaeon]
MAKLLPTIRAKLAQELVRMYDMKQVDVAKALGITQAAVSHYITKSRGVDQEILRRFPEIHGFVGDIARKIHDGLARSDQIARIDRFCYDLMKTARFCEYHKKVGDMDPFCTACFPEPPKP